MKQPYLYYFETIKITLQAWSKFTENTRLRLVFSIQNLTGLVTSFLWFQNNIDQAASLNKCLPYDRGNDEIFVEIKVLCILVIITV